jgi:hypothetical protein
MSTENTGSSTAPLPGLAPEHPANAGMLAEAFQQPDQILTIPAHGPVSPARAQLRDAGPLEWPAPASEQEKATGRARFTDVKARVIDADPDTLRPAEKFAQQVAQDERAAAAQAAAPAKPKRTRTAKAKAADGDEKDKSAEVKRKPTSTRAKSKAEKKVATTPEQGAPAAGDKIPAITDDAIAFLGRKDAPAADMFKLSREGRTFVQYHLGQMARREADDRLNTAFLLANARPVSPAYQKFVDALHQHGKKLPPSMQALAKGKGSASYAPKHDAVQGYAPATVELRKLDIPATEPTAPIQGSPDERTRASIPIATAQMLASLPIDDITPQETAELVEGDLGAFSGIKNATTRRRALAAIAQSVAVQPRYKAELERQAPALAKELGERFKAEVENTIEPGPAIKWKDLPSQETLQAAPAAKAPERVTPASAARPSLGKRFLQSIGATTLKAGTWLAEQGRGEPTPAPVSLTKTADPAVPAAAPVANPVPENVARRFLKVEQDYYFPDKTHAFADRGNKLATRGHHPEVVRALVEVAKARGWDSITVKGTDAFRREAWLEAAQNGMRVSGYQPSVLDLAELSQRPTRNSVEKGAAKQQVPQPTAQQAAVDAAETTPAQASAAVAAGPQAPSATQPAPVLAAKAKAFETDKPTFVVKKYPELAGAYGIVEAAKLFAAEKLPEGARDEFVSLARRHVMQKIVAGQQINGPKVYLAATTQKDAAERVGEGTNQGKPPRAKEHARER